MSYNGWTNYATWCLHLWITNEEGLYNAWRDCAVNALEEAMQDLPDGASKEEIAKQAKYELSDQLKTAWEWQASDLKLEGFWSDLMGSALSDVDWHEVAAALMEEVVDE